jgi:hypothetical protein
VLQKFQQQWVQDITVGLYLLLYLFPVAFVVSKKIRVSTSTQSIEEGTFCFKPARSVRLVTDFFFFIHDHTH